MPFPKSPRVFYERNPLEQVICQVRFPSILRIESEKPAAFQERIRSSYPLLTEGYVEQFPLPKSLERLLGELPKSPYFEFASEDEVWKVSLNKESLALATTKYRRWEEFREHLEFPLCALVEVYSPSFYTLIGLRYRDVIQQSKLGSKQVPWAELLEPHIAGTLSHSQLAGSISHIAQDLVVDLQGQEGKVRLKHGLIHASENGETCYVIDSDFYIEKKTETKHAIEILNGFNKKAGRLFRWCIKPKLHDAMGPKTSG